MPHTVKFGDAQTLRWNLGRNLTGVSTARVIVSPGVGGTPVIDRDGVIDSPATGGIVSLQLAVDDYGAGSTDLQVGKTYSVEIKLSPGPVTHPSKGYEALSIDYSLG